MGYRHDVAEVLSRLLTRLPDVREKTGVSGRPQFFAGERLFAFVAGDGVAVKLPGDVVRRVVDHAEYLPFKMRNKPVLREWIRIRHEDAAAYKRDAALFRQAIRFVRAPTARPGPASRAGVAPARRRRAE